MKCCNAETTIPSPVAQLINVKSLELGRFENCPNVITGGATQCVYVSCIGVLFCNDQIGGIDKKNPMDTFGLEKVS